jgi:tetratricopeptide (TPR) repeat protein
VSTDADPANAIVDMAAADDVESLAAAAMDAADGGRIAEAERLARRALALAEAPAASRNRDDPLSRSLRALGTMHRARGQYLDAERAFTRALGHATRAFGAESLEVAELQNDLGMTFKYVGRFADAEAAYDRARQILDELPDVDQEDVAALFHNLGGLAHARGDFATAEPLARRAVEIRMQAFGPRDPATLLDRSAHAAILFGLGRIDEAETSIRGLLGDLEAALGADHPEVAVALNNLAAILQSRGGWVEAESLYRRVIAVKEARFGVGSPALAVPLNNLGTALLAQGRADEATVMHVRALGLLEQAVEPDHPNLAAVRRNLARSRSAALTGMGHPKRVSRGRSGGAC